MTRIEMKLPRNGREYQETRRRHLRTQVMVPVTFWWSAEHGRGSRAKGLTRNISAQGLYIVTADAPPENANVRFEFILPAVERAESLLNVTGKGRITRVEDLGEDGFGFAVEAHRLLSMARRLPSEAAGLD